MKKITIPIVMGLLCLNFWALAQENKAIDVTTKGIQVGQQMPDVMITGIHNYKTATAKISDFKGKVIILDFWATWCSPCVAMIPGMDSLQQVYREKIQFISVTYEAGKEVLPFLERLEKKNNKKYNLPQVIADKELHKLFPHVYLPHYVWIDKNGVVGAITGPDAVTGSNIQKILGGARISAQKKDMQIAFDAKKPLLINGNGGEGENLISHAVLTGYMEGIEGSSTVSTSNKLPKKIRITNLPLLNLIQMAYGDGKYIWRDSRTVVQVKENKITSALSGNEFLQWMKEGNGFSYEILLPANSKRNLWQQMKTDLSDLLEPYEISIEDQMKPCLAIVKITEQISFRADEKPYRYSSTVSSLDVENTFFSVLIWSLESNYLKNNSLAIINDTGYKDKIKLNLRGNLNTKEGLNLALASYGLKIVEKDMSIPVLVIRDKKMDSNVGNN